MIKKVSLGEIRQQRGSARHPKGAAASLEAEDVPAVGRKLKEERPPRSWTSFLQDEIKLRLVVAMAELAA